MPSPRRLRHSRWDEDNRLALNPWPIVVGAVFVGLLAGLAYLLSRV